MRTTARVASFALLTVVAVAAGCHSAPPPPPPVIVPLTDSASAALAWVQSHAAPLAVGDSIPNAAERAQLTSFAGDARVIGISELTEGTHEFPAAVGRILFALADSANVRALAIQAPMAEAMEVDRYVRTGVGDPRRSLRTLASWRWETPEMLALVNAVRAWNRTHDATKQIGFYGFEIPTATHAVDVVNALPDSIAGTPLKSWFRREYPCVLRDEAARFGNGGRASDSTFWRACGAVATAAVDSIVALRARLSPARSAQVAFVEQMARLVQHHVTTGLRYLPRQEVVADHVMYLADMLGPNAKLFAWGGDVEMGRLTLDKTTVQTGQVLGQRLGSRFRTLAFLFGDGTVRARMGTFGRNGEPSDLTTVTVLPPTAGMYEDVLSRAPIAAYWLDMRALPNDIAGAWLRGPHPARLITELYVPASAQSFETPLEFPKFFDGAIFIKHVTAPR
jgi:erythromycin esterase-like protein